METIIEHYILTKGIININYEKERKAAEWYSTKRIAQTS